ncbi:hypothetical protein POM88_013442 [Heracleum sosnowskyi]|uniref:Uncharacterized protein n=1 Tax=Heracleum sosnowskyi TaxID=360622 RepID=A0AAD8IZ53_9APIA|nr:hypothetical protein POM88_013442 [Heracleum sosnowskyi]
MKETGGKSVSGVESVKGVDTDLNKLTVIGSVDPSDKIEKRTKKKVEIISSKKDKENKNDGDGNDKKNSGDKQAKNEKNSGDSTSGSEGSKTSKTVKCFWQRRYQERSVNKAKEEDEDEEEAYRTFLTEFGVSEKAIASSSAMVKDTMKEDKMRRRKQ